MSSATVIIPASSLSQPLVSASSQPERLPVEVIKPTPYVYSLSYLTATDPNPLPTSQSLLSLPCTDLNSTLQATARDGAQSLITTLLTTTTIQSTPDALLMLLSPASETTLRLPRWKSLPKPKPPTKWETFAKKKGIGKFSNASGGAKREEVRKNMVYDEESGEWVKKWGYKGKNKTEGEWLVEVDEKKKKVEEEGRNVRGEGKRERMERVRRQQRKERNNVNRAGKMSG
jgi:regulator of ribosome biosynthesis